MEKIIRGKVDERMWWAVKTLLKGGSTVKDAAAYFELSENTVSRIKMSESFEEYKQMTAAAHAKYRKPKMRLPEKPVDEPVEEVKPVEPEKIVEHRQIVQVQASHYMLTEQQKTNELLTLISNKLAFIVDELCGVKNKGVEA